VLRYDFREDGEALISIFLVPGGQGGGVGTQLIREGSLWLRKNHPAVGRIRAEVLTRNIPSMKAFRNAGYEDLFMTFEEILQ
jgi:RimJ/RimL family protein N-acetyltransferase